MMDLQEVNIDTMRALPGWARQEAIQLRKEWIKKVRREDKRQHYNFLSKIAGFKYDDNKRYLSKRYIQIDKGVALVHTIRIRRNGEINNRLAYAYREPY